MELAFSGVVNIKKNLLILIIVFLTLIVSVNADWYNESFNYCRNITGVVLANYSYLLELDSASFNYSKIQDDGSDLRIVKGDCGEYVEEAYFWIESINKSGKSYIWFRTIANDTTGIYSIYYTATGAVSKSNINNTFNYGDDFTGNKGWTIGAGSPIFNGSLYIPTGDGRTWLYRNLSHPNNYLMKTRLAILSSSPADNLRYGGGSVGETMYGTTNGIMLGAHTQKWAYYSGAWRTNTTNVGNYDWVVQEVRANSTNGLYDYYQNNGLISTKQSSISAGAVGAFIWDDNNAAFTTISEWLIITNYDNTATNPTTGTEQTLEVSDHIFFKGTSTPSGSKLYYPEQNNIFIEVSVEDFTSTNTTIYIYSEGLIIDSETGSGNISANFSGLGTGVYYFNASASNGATTHYTVTRTATIYNITTNNIKPLSGEIIQRYINLSWGETITPAGTVYISNRRLSLINSSDDEVTIINENLTTNNIDNLDLLPLINNIGNHNVKIILTDDQDKNFSFYTENFNVTTNAQLNITAKYNFTGAAINNFNVSIKRISTGITQNYETNAGLLTINILKGEEYNIIIDAGSLYDLKNVTETYNDNYNTLTNNFFTPNSIRINIYKETDFTIINDTEVSVTFSNNISTVSRTTSNGTLYEDGLNDGVWQIIFFSTNYSYRTYTITVNNRSHQNLDAYLIPSTYSTVFRIKDSLTLASLSGASFTMQRLSESGWIVVESRISDVSGSIQVGYLPGITYRFTISLTGYQSKIFELNPIIFSSYDVYLDKIAGITSPLEYMGVSIVYYPKLFVNNQENTLTAQIISPEGKLINYYVSAEVSNDPAVYWDYGVLANGEIFIIPFNISNATYSDRVKLYFSYNTTTEGVKEFIYYHEIIGDWFTKDGTIASIKTKDYGLGMFESGLMVMIVMIIITGSAFAIAGFGGGLVVGLMVLGTAVWLGFLPLWSVVISFIAGITLIIAVGVGGQK